MSVALLWHISSLRVRKGLVLVRSYASIVALALSAALLTDPAISAPRGAPNAIMIDAGWAADTDFTRMVFQPWTDNFKELHMVGASYSTRLGTVNELLGNSAFGSYGDNLTVEAEIGLSDRFGKENLGEVWTALYLRYDGFQWNDKVYTTLALDTGVSMLTDTSKFELSRDSGGQSSELLHYLGPEVTFADPDNKDLEWVFRLHHRSGVFGVIDGVRAGSTFASVGVRIRF